MIKCFIIFAALIISSGCFDNAELQRANNEIFILKKDQLRANDQTAAQKTEVASLTARIQQVEADNNALNTKNTELVSQLDRALSDLSGVSNQFEKLKSAILKQRQATYAAQQESQRKREAALKTMEANKPEGYPFRLFNVQFVGKWRVGDVNAEHGKFSIRNYTDEELVGMAIAGRPDGNDSYIDPYTRQLIWRVPTVRVTVPPNSSKENIYIQANKDSRIIVKSNIGSKSVGWGETK